MHLLSLLLLLPEEDYDWEPQPPDYLPWSVALAVIIVPSLWFLACCWMVGP